MKVFRFIEREPTRAYYRLVTMRDGELRAMHTSMDFHRAFVARYGKHEFGTWSYAAPASATVYACDAATGDTGSGCPDCLARAVAA